MNIGRFAQSKLIRFFFPASERAKYRALSARSLANSRINVISVAMRDLCVAARKVAPTREDDFQGKPGEKNARDSYRQAF
jgi:hypothetical protein